jgi:hypothetical protein
VRMKVHIENGQELPPEDRAYYIVGENGTFLRNDIGWASYVVPVKKMTALKPVSSSLTLRLPKIPPELFSQIIGFFHAVKKKHDSEAAVLLHYGEGGWAVSCPEQTVGPGTVKYDMTERLPGKACVGTMHSHVDMSAFHSGVDEKDEAAFDGLHLTVGKISRSPSVDVDAEVVIRGHRFKPSADALIEGVVPYDDSVPIEYSEQELKDKPWLKWQTKSYNNPKYTHTAGESDFPAEWMDRVKRETYTYSTGSGYGHGWGFEEYGGEDMYDGYYGYGHGGMGSGRRSIRNGWKSPNGDGHGRVQGASQSKGGKSTKEIVTQSKAADVPFEFGDQVELVEDHAMEAEKGATARVVGIFPPLIKVDWDMDNPHWKNQYNGRFGASRFKLVTEALEPPIGHSEKDASAREGE